MKRRLGCKGRQALLSLLMCLCSKCRVDTEFMCMDLVECLQTYSVLWCTPFVCLLGFLCVSQYKCCDNYNLMWFAIDSKCVLKASWLVTLSGIVVCQQKLESPNSVTLYPKLRPIVVQNSQFYLVKKLFICISQNKKKGTKEEYKQFMPNFLL